MKNISCSQLAVLACLLSGCRSLPEDGRFQRHLHADVWTQGIQRHFEDPRQWIPEIGMVAATAGLVYFDAGISEESSRLTGDTLNGNVLSQALGISPLVVGGVAWLGGDEGESFEVAAEALLLTVGVTQGIKALTGRHRPGRSPEHDSFPSGHTSFAAAGATLLARDIETRTGSRLGYLFFVPAVLVGVNRVEGERHWASDVAAGAVLGMVLSNWVYNAHVPHEHVMDPTIYRRRTNFDWSLQPEWLDGRLMIGLRIQF